MTRPRPIQRAFTLVELLVVIGIIAILIAILIPALSGARRQANDLRCASNIRQLVTAMVLYANESKGRFPVNYNDVDLVTSGNQANYWYDAERIGRFLPKTVQYASGSIGGNVFICPNDLDAARSYCMNYWASGAVDSYGYGYDNIAGKHFTQDDKPGSRLMLIIEAYAKNGAPGTYATSSTVGAGGISKTNLLAPGNLPGRRFLGDLAVSSARFGTTPTEVDYSRHRKPKGEGTNTEARGRLHIGFADGHVEQFTADDLADRTTGKSRLTALWSPVDPRINK